MITGTLYFARCPRCDFVQQANEQRKLEDKCPSCMYPDPPHPGWQAMRNSEIVGEWVQQNPDRGAHFRKTEGPFDDADAEESGESAELMNRAWQANQEKKYE